MDSEELKRLLNEAYDADSLKKFNAALNKANAQAESLSEAQKKELAQFKKLGDAREKLIRASSNLSDRFAKAGQSLGMADDKALAFGKGAATSTTFVGKFGSAIYEGTGSFREFTKSLEEFGPIGSMLARLGGTLGDTTDMFKNLSSVGANFNKNLIEMREAANNAGLPLADFADLVTKNSENLAQLFGTTTEGAKQFSALAQTFRQSNLTELAPLGLTVEELNEQFLSTLTIARRTGMIEGMDRQQRLDAGLRLIKQFDRLAKLTGQQRDAIASQMEAQLANSRLQAAFTEMTPQVREQMQGLSTSIATLAPGLAAGMNDLIASGGVASTEAARDFIAFFSQGGIDIKTVLDNIKSGAITYEDAVLQLQTAAGTASDSLSGVGKFGVVPFIDELLAPAKQLATANFDVVKANSEQQKAADKLTQELTEFENSAKNLSSAFQGTETQFMKFLNNLLGEGTGTLTDAMNILSDKIKGFSTGTQAAIFATTEAVKGLGGFMLDTAPHYAGTLAALKTWSATGGNFMGGMGGGGKGKGFFNKAGRFVSRAGGIGMGGYGMYAMGEMADNAETTGEKAVGVAGSAASGAIAGATIGSLVPVIGTGIGAAIGGALGGLYGLYKASDMDNNQLGTVGTTGSLRVPNDTLSKIHAGERVLNKAETDAYLSSVATGGGMNETSALGNKITSTNSNLQSLLKEMQTLNSNVNTLVAVNHMVEKNTDKTQKRLANRSESLV